MAIDSETKRRSAIHIALPFGRVLPVPDSSILDEDRAHAGYMYSGYDYAGDDTGAGFFLKNYRRRRRTRR